MRASMKWCPRAWMVRWMWSNRRARKRLEYENQAVKIAAEAFSNESNTLRWHLNHALQVLFMCSNLCAAQDKMIKDKDAELAKKSLPEAL